MSGMFTPGNAPVQEPPSKVSPVQDPTAPPVPPAPKEDTVNTSLPEEDAPQGGRVGAEDMTGKEDNAQA